MTIPDRILSLSLPFFGHWAYWIILFGTMLEAMPIGFLIPGQTIVILSGFLASIGILSLWDVIIVAFIGSFIGDLLGYLIGRKYGYPLISKYGKYFFLKKENFKKINKLVDKHTGKTLIIGRFNPATRSFAPFIIGASNIGAYKLIVYNIFGSAIWAASFVIIGYIFGQGYEAASKYIGRFIFISIALSILIVYAYKLINKRKHIFSKYYLHILILNISSLYLFSKMMEDVANNQLITKLDMWVNAKMVLLWNPPLNKIMIFVTSIADPINLFIISSILFLAAVYKKKHYHSFLLLFGLGGGLFLDAIIKLIIHRARPENALIQVSGYSFPSNHATMSIIFFCMLFYSFKRDIKSKLVKNTFMAASMTLFLLVGFSRIYLNVHWLSDVIAGFALGIFWLTLLILIFKYAISSAKNKRSIFNKVRRNVERYVRLAKMLKRDKRTPKICKVLFGLAIAYFIMPVDFIPDFIPFFGQLDDAIIVPSLIFIAIKMMPKEVLDEHYKKMLPKK